MKAQASNFLPPEPVRFYTETLTFPYYVPAPPDTLPPLVQEHTPRSKRVYPYALYELTGNQAVASEFPALVLENRYLKLTVLPDLGGRLVSLFDKVGGQELLFRNPVLKPVMAGLTGAWCGTGVEFNFPGSHSVTSNLPVHCHGEVNPDGSASIVIADREMLSGMRWSVRLTLRKDSDAVFQTSQFSNRTSMPHPAYWWNNAKVPAFSDTEFVLPQCSHGVIHPPMDITRIAGLKLPFVNEIDISRYRSVFFQLPLFFRELRSKSFGVYHREHGFGLLHHGEYGTLVGRKIWTLGTGDDGKVTTENLSDGFGPNIEIQAGLLPVQTDFFLLAPGETFSWNENWIPVRDMLEKHLITGPDFTISGNDRKMRIQCHRDLPEVVLKTANAESAAFTPRTGEIFSFDFTCPEFSLTDRGSGFTLLETADPHWKPAAVEVPDGFYADAEEKALFGRYREESGVPEEAAGFYREALKMNPGNIHALNALAVRELRLGRPEQALEYLHLALTKDRRNASSSYFCGLAENILGDEAQAVFHLERACFDPAWRPAACALLGKMYLKKRRKTELEGLLAAAPETEEMLEIAVVYKRLTGQERRHELAQLRKTAPENPLPDFEEGKIPCFNDPMKAVLLSAFYLDLNLAQDSRRAAMLFADKNPLAAYLADNYAEAESRSLAGVFPPPELEHTLKSLWVEHPELPKLTYYYGVALAANDNWEEAGKVWEKSRSLGCAEPELFRNLGIYYEKTGDLSHAALCYRNGFNPEKVNYKFVMEYDKLLERLKCPEEREALLSRIPEAMKNNPYIVVRRASLAAYRKKWTEVLKLLSGRRFVLCEGKRMTSSLFIEANCALGLAASEKKEFGPALQYFMTALSYPHELGVGRSSGKFDMKIKYLIVETLYAAGRKQEAERKKAEYLDECRRLAIDFDALSTIRRECGKACEDSLIRENQFYFEKLKERR